MKNQLVVAMFVLAHRVILSPEAQLRGATAEDVLDGRPLVPVVVAVVAVSRGGGGDREADGGTGGHGHESERGDAFHVQFLTLGN
jgi:hypothetical protein